MAHLRYSTHSIYLADYFGHSICLLSVADCFRPLLLLSSHHTCAIDQSINIRRPSIACSRYTHRAPLCAPPASMLDLTFLLYSRQCALLGSRDLCWSFRRRNIYYVGILSTSGRYTTVLLRYKGTINSSLSLIVAYIRWIVIFLLGILRYFVRAPYCINTIRSREHLVRWVSPERPNAMPPLPCRHGRHPPPARLPIPRYYCSSICSPVGY